MYKYTTGVAQGTSWLPTVILHWQHKNTIQFLVFRQNKKSHCFSQSWVRWTLAFLPLPNPAPGMGAAGTESGQAGWDVCPGKGEGLTLCGFLHTEKNKVPFQCQLLLRGKAACDGPIGDTIYEGIFQKFLQISGTWQCPSLDVVQGDSPTIATLATQPKMCSAA